MAPAIFLTEHCKTYKLKCTIQIVSNMEIYIM